MRSNKGSKSFLIRISVEELTELGFNSAEIVNIDSLAHNEHITWEILQQKLSDFYAAIYEEKINTTGF